MSAVGVARPAAPAASREMTYLEAISNALRTEMRRDEAVFCLGEDIGAFGGAFKVTELTAELVERTTAAHVDDAAGG